MSTVNKVIIRMYKTGTGDCFGLKFCAGDEVVFKMMIDGGTWKGSKAHLTKYVKDIKAFFDNQIHRLVITHEHKDHVHLFDACKSLLLNRNFSIDKVWMAWTENDESGTVKKWKKEYGQKKLALARASEKLSNLVADDEYKRAFEEDYNGTLMMEARENYSAALSDLTDLHASKKNGVYTNGLAGMENIKDHLDKDKYEYFKPGTTIDGLEDLPNVKFHVLGPPELVKAVKKEKGRKGSGETYDHNKDLEKSDAFSAALHRLETSYDEGAIPFKSNFIDENEALKSSYSESAWRKIDHDWLYSAGLLALRMESATNNLSLVLAIEIGESGKVLLFPGDAEYGSWASWHDIEWDRKGKDGKHLTEDLLNRTVFYKVAHHLSQNGTARKKGMDMLTNPDLHVMATLDYDCISPKWKSTMPNRGLLKDIIRQSKGRFVVMNKEGLFYDFKQKEPLQDRIDSERNRLTNKERTDFQNAWTETSLYHELTLNL